ncbi:MAG: hypothetical protein AAFP03_15795 [Cyanobacteria bacterium J06598_3]
MAAKPANASARLTFLKNSTMRHNNSLLTEPLIFELIQKRQKLSVQLQSCQKMIETLLKHGQGDSADHRADQTARWDVIAELKTRRIRLSTRIELINELLDLGESAVSDLPEMPNTAANVSLEP